MKEIAVPSSTIAWCEQALAAKGAAVVGMQPLRVEASHRCFYRVQTNQGSVVLMDSPPRLERNEQFALLGAVFHRHAIPVAEILAHDQTQGLFLLEDLGDVHLEDSYGTSLEDEALTAAIDLLPRLAAVTDPAIEPYTAERLYTELDVFSEWFIGKLLGLKVDAGSYQDICERLVTAIDAQPKCCTHRDYHCRNLLYSNGRLGVVDFQDALHGPVLYDIASLLRDCYHVFAEADIDHWLGYFTAQTPQLEAFPIEQIKRWFDWTAIQRQLKAVGIFSRMYLRDSKVTHLVYILPLLERINACAGDYPELQPLNEQLSGCIESAKPILADLT